MQGTHQSLPLEVRPETAQADISALHGKTIIGATISFFSQFDVPNPARAPEPLLLRIISFGSDGVLRHEFPNPPSDLGHLDFTHSQGLSTFDITSLVADRVASNEAWLGLYFAPAQQLVDALMLWSIPTTALDADTAQLRLTIEYADLQILEPASLALFGAAFMAMGMFGRRKRKVA